MSWLEEQKMNEYDMRCSEEFTLLQSKVEPFFINDKVDCPYHLPYTATFHQAMFGPLNERVMELFLSAGYRRNGNSMYDMRCEQCNACTSIRIHPHEFVPNRNQKRTLKKNSDIDIKIQEARVDKERLELCEHFLQTRYPQRKNTAWGYYSCFFLNQVTTTYEIQFILDGMLAGVSVVDIGANWMNAVYFYFDPDLHSRSLGTFNILKMIDFCKEKQIAHLYLGYTIKGVAAMEYKERFYPHYLLKDGRWEKITKS